MDEQELKDILDSEIIPPADENARKNAINLALAAFDETQKEKKNKRQGFGLWGRLTGRTNSPIGRRPMKKQYVIGGMATATAVVLAIGIYGMPEEIKPIQVASVSGSDTRKMDAATARADSTRKAKPEVKAKTEIKIAALADKDRRNTGRTSLNPPSATLPIPSESRQGLIHALKPQRLVKQSRNFDWSRSSAGVGSAFGGIERLANEAPLKQFKSVGRDQFANVEQNGIKRVADDPISTFSTDVDTASYSFVRRMLNGGNLPQKNSVRVEELINYFHYDYPRAATKEQPFQPTVTVVPSPWKKGNKLIHIGIRGYDIEPAEKPRSNLVFLLDVSGSMRAADKLPLVITSLKLLLETLKPDDTVAIVVYAGAAGTVLEPTKVAEKHKILAALERLNAGGSTAGGAGIRRAYSLAEGNFDKEAVNRIILATDGDFNVGINNREELKSFVERKRKTGVFLSILGFGQGNLNDHLMQTLAQNGNGTAAHIDTLNEARKVLVDEASSTLFPIAKDVKIQVEFNPKTVAEYRLIGYETRALKREDFNNDNVDAGDMGSGHSVTAIYEITPVGGERMIGDSRYQNEGGKTEISGSSNTANEYAFLKIRYKQPQSDTSQLISMPITTSHETTAGVGQLREARWAIAVAAFGQLLKGGKYTGGFSYNDVIEMARAAKGDDEFGYRAEFINLVRLARSASVFPNK